MYVLENRMGLRREAPRGFSWTTLFFGIFVPLLRGDFKWFLLMLLINGLTFGFAMLVFPFIYNKLYLNDLLRDGYKII